MEFYLKQKDEKGVSLIVQKFCMNKDRRIGFTLYHTDIYNTYIKDNGELPLPSVALNKYALDIANCMDRCFPVSERCGRLCDPVEWLEAAARGIGLKVTIEENVVHFSDPDAWRRLASILEK